MKEQIDILIVGDNPDHTFLLRELINGTLLNCTFDVAGNFEKCMEILQTKEFDIIFCNYFIPGISGLDMVRKINKNKITTPVVMLAETGDERIAVEAMKLGVYDYVSKSGISSRVLKRIIITTLEKKHLRDEKARLEHIVFEQNISLQHKNQELEKLVRLKSDLLSSLSHELRTPLNTIIGFSELLIDKIVGDINKKQEEYLNTMCVSAKNLLGMINEILDYSRLEAEKTEIKPDMFDISELLEEVIDYFKPSAEKKNISIEFSPNRVETKVFGDFNKVRHILTNLLSNAVKFNKENGRVRVHLLTPTKHDSRDYLQISVTDEGIGISEEHLDLVFEEFRQVKDEITWKHEGAGLGLFIAKKFVELNGGEIWVESEKGKGANFSFTLPLRPGIK